MSYRIVHFPLQLNRQVDAQLHYFRASVADMFRADITRDFARGESAGIDHMTICQKFSLKWGQAQRASKMVRDVPTGLINWAINAELRLRMQGRDLTFPVAPANTVGSFQVSDVKLLNRCVVSISMGGMGGVGVIAEYDMPAVAMHEFAEVRITYDAIDDAYYGALVFNSHNGYRDPVEDPVDADLEDA